MLKEGLKGPNALERAKVAIRKTSFVIWPVENRI